jgi:Tfp pilus assembly protein PilE
VSVPVEELLFRQIKTMTKLPPAVGLHSNHEKVIEENEEGKRLDFNRVIMKESRAAHVGATLAQNVDDLGDDVGDEKNSNHELKSNPANESDYNDYDDEASDTGDDDSFDEPLGYRSFLYDVNIEYSPGGNLSSSLSNKHCFKMKCLPYMVENNKSELSVSRSSSIDTEDITSDMINCDRRHENSVHERCPDGDSHHELNVSQQGVLLDVTKETCAFLSNSDYVPNSKFKSRRVVLELVAAKLAHSNGYTIPPNSSFTNLLTLAEDNPSSISTPIANSSETSSIRSCESQSSRGSCDQTARNQLHFSTPTRITPNPTLSHPPVSPTSSRKFVNYTILIKTVPGLDKYPAVIERRFSDFLILYQGLKSNETIGHIVDKNVAFPKKVYMGNFSLEKIAERGIEFTRLLQLCMSEFDLRWSVPFVAFLVDKELTEAHRLALFGDPDDVQALIETAYHIERKLYIRFEPSTRYNTSTNSPDLINSQNQSYSPTLPRVKPTSSPNVTLSNKTISANNGNSSTNNHNNTQSASDDSESSVNASQNDSNCDTSYGSRVVDMTVLSPINRRILVTFCLLFVTYRRTNNFPELKKVAREFCRLIESQEYIDSLINTSHYNSLRACLLFLMNMTQGDVIDDNLRLRLKRRLEDIDGSKAEIVNSLNGHRARSNTRESNGLTSTRTRLSITRNGTFNEQRSTRITKNDLTSLLRDRNFCLFQT